VPSRTVMVKLANHRWELGFS